jgi:hypothetical protein
MAGGATSKDQPGTGGNTVIGALIEVTGVACISAADDYRVR